MKMILLIMTLLAFNVMVNSQTNTKTDSIIPVENARYLKEDLTQLLFRNVQYPILGQQQNIQGDVVLSFIITRDGFLDSLVVDSSPGNSLSSSAIKTMGKIIANAWSPAKINNQPIDKRYSIIFRYRISLNTLPIDYKEKATKSFAKQKYKTALEFYTKALTDNPYDQELFESRSKVKAEMGDSEGAKLDHLASLELQDEIMSVVNIYAFGVTRQTSQRVTSLPGQHVRQRF